MAHVYRIQLNRQLTDVNIKVGEWLKIYDALQAELGLIPTSHQMKMKVQALLATGNFDHIVREA